MLDKRGYPHFMLKEIMEQPEALENCFRGRIVKEFGTAQLGGLHMEPRDFLDIDRVAPAGLRHLLHGRLRRRAR